MDTKKAPATLVEKKIRSLNNAKQLLAFLTLQYSELRDAPLTQIIARLSPARHSIDFRSVRWYGVDYVFTPAQSLIVKALWKAWENNTPRIGARTLLRASSMVSDKISDLFKEHPAWNVMIMTDSKGNYWLSPNPS